LRILFLTGLIVLSGCAGTPPPADETRVAIVWNRIDDAHRVCESLSGRKNFFNILGCSQRIEPTEAGAPRICAIYAPAPRNERDMQRFATLGHELLHCFDGNWHDKWGRMTSPPSVAASPPSAAAGGTAARIE
jgi:hypothetical protein